MICLIQSGVFLTALNCFDSPFAFKPLCWKLVQIIFWTFVGYLPAKQWKTIPSHIFFHHSHMFQNNRVFFQTCQIWSEHQSPEVQLFVHCVNKSCHVICLIQSRSFSTPFNCFDSLFLSSRCVENWLRLFSWTSLGVYQPNKGNG